MNKNTPKSLEPKNTARWREYNCDTRFNCRLQVPRFNEASLKACQTKLTKNVQVFFDPYKTKTNLAMTMICKYKVLE